MSTFKIGQTVRVRRYPNAVEESALSAFEEPKHEAAPAFNALANEAARARESLEEALRLLGSTDKPRADVTAANLQHAAVQAQQAVGYLYTACGMARARAERLKACPATTCTKP